MDRSKVSSLLFVSKSMRVRANTLSPYICNARSFLNLKLISAFFQARVRLERQQLTQSRKVRVSLQKYASKDINNETGISPFPFVSLSASQQGLKPQYFAAPFAAITNNDFPIAFESETFPTVKSSLRTSLEPLFCSCHILIYY